MMPGIAIGCTNRASETDASTRGRSIAATPATDSLCGVLRVVGSEPGVLLRLDGPQGRSPSLNTSQPATLRTLSGLDLCVFGSGDQGGTWVVDRFLVTAKAGVPVVDGVLRLIDAQTVIETADGRRVRLGQGPPELRREVGQRIWVTQDERGNVTSFGVIR